MILHSPVTIERYTSDGLWGDRTLLDVVAAHVANVPERVAIVDTPDREALIGSPATSVSWREVGHAVDAIATGLVRRGVKKDDVVVAQLPNVWELIALYFAVSRAGGVLSPVAMQWRETELHIVLYSPSGMKFSRPSPP